MPRVHLVLLVGPQAVGKMAVGQEIAARTPYRLFHNHATIEPLLDVFDWGTPAFDRLREEFRRRVIEEAVADGLPGLVLTLVWAFDLPSETDGVQRLLAPVRAAGGRIDVVELYADEQTRLAREGTDLRLVHKRSKRDVAWARAHLVESGREHVLSTDADHPFPLPDPYLRLDTTNLSAAEAAAEVLTRLDLPRSTD